MKIWLVEGEHQSVPGTVVRICATPDIAARKAAELVQKIVGNGVTATAETWQRTLSDFIAENDELFNYGEPYVEITEHEVLQ